VTFYILITEVMNGAKVGKTGEGSGMEVIYNNDSLLKTKRIKNIFVIKNANSSAD